MKKIVASVAVGVAALACAASADAYTVSTQYSRGGCTTTGVHITSWSGGSSSTWGSVNGYSFKWGNNQWNLQDTAYNRVSGVGKGAVAFTYSRQDANTRFETVHKGSFISGSIGTSVNVPGSCA